MPIDAEATSVFDATEEIRAAAGVWHHGLVFLRDSQYAGASMTLKRLSDSTRESSNVSIALATFEG